MRKILLALYPAVLWLGLAWPITAAADTEAGLINTGPLSGVTVDPATSRIFASQPGNVLVIDGWTHATTSIPIPGGAIAVNSVSRKAYVTDAANDRIAVLDTSTLSHFFLAVGDNPADVAVNAATNRIYVTNSAAGTVTVIDGGTNATTTLTVGTNPTGVAVNPATNKIYVANSGSASLSVIDGATGTVTPVAVAASPAVVAVNPVLNKIYVTHTDSNEVTILDGATNATGAVAAAQYANALAVDPITHKVYIGARGNNGLEGVVTVIDGQTLAPTYIDSGQVCCRVAVNPTTNKAYAAANGSSCSICPPDFTGPLQVIDGATSTVAQAFAFGGNALAVNPVTNKIYATYHFQGSAGFVSAGIRVLDGASNTTATVASGPIPSAVAANPATNRFYVVNSSAGSVTVLDANGATLATVTVGSVPIGIASNPATNKIYVTNYASGTVTVIDGGSNGTTTVAAGTQPMTLAVNPVTDKIYIANYGSDNVTVIDGATNATSTVAVGTDPASVAVDTHRNLVYVVNNIGATVTVIDGATNTTTTVPVGMNPFVVAVDSVLGKAFVANGSSNVTVIQAPGYTTESIAVGAAQNAIAVNEVTHKVYSANANNTVSVIDAATHAVAPVNVTDAFTLAVNPGTNKIYVGRSTGTSLAIIDGVMNTASDVTAGAAPHRLAVDAVLGKLAVANANATDVTLLTDTAWQNIPPNTTITPLPGNRTANPTPTFTFTTSAGVNGAPTQAVFYQVDTYQGPWLKASGSGPHTGTLPRVTPGSHVLYAFAVDANVARPNGAVTGRMSAYVFTVSAECLTTSCVDVSVTHTATPSQGSTGKDMVFVLTATNTGPQDATNVTLTDSLPAGSMFVWASPGCTHASGTVTCDLGTLASGSSLQRDIVVRPAAAGTALNTASVAAAELDTDSANNQSVASVPVVSSPAANLVLRYRLYSDVTKEHHFTTDLNEYTVLGGNGNWVQEGTVGRVLDNPGSFGGVEAVPYYRMYDTSTRWHHWTTDPNEYYTLIQFPNWIAENVDGYILPTQAPGTIPLYRLLYPFIAGLHHWTIDQNEYDTLIASYGWVGEGGAGFVIP